MESFLDFSAQFYNIAGQLNHKAYANMLKAVSEAIPAGATVLEVGAGTGAISIAVSEKAGQILCTDISEEILAAARNKSAQLGINNIKFETLNILDTDMPDGAFDIVIASQVLHKIDNSAKGAAELRRIAKTKVILPMHLIKNSYGVGKDGVEMFRMPGFSPEARIDSRDYEEFLTNLGFSGCEIIRIAGLIPMVVAIWTHK